MTPMQKALQQYQSEYNNRSYGSISQTFCDGYKARERDYVGRTCKTCKYDQHDRIEACPVVFRTTIIQVERENFCCNKWEGCEDV